MIRIKNISRENRLVRKLNYDILLPGGKRKRLLVGRTTDISYATYILNKFRTVLPGEPLHDMAAFRVISGVEEIMAELNDRAIHDPQPVREEEPIVTVTAPDPVVEELPSVEVVETETEPEVEAPAESGDVDAITDSEPEQNDVQYEIIEERATTGKYNRDELSEMVHRELNELLDSEGIDIPRNVNKQQKIDALMKLNG